MVQLGRWGRQALKVRKGVTVRPDQPDRRAPEVRSVHKDLSDLRDPRGLQVPMDHRAHKVRPVLRVQLDQQAQKEP